MREQDADADHDDRGPAHPHARRGTRSASPSGHCSRASTPSLMPLRRRVLVPCPNASGRAADTSLFDLELPGRLISVVDRYCRGVLLLSHSWRGRTGENRSNHFFAYQCQCPVNIFNIFPLPKLIKSHSYYFNFTKTGYGSVKILNNNVVILLIRASS
jgi:hypothetical protein